VPRRLVTARTNTLSSSRLDISGRLCDYWRSEPAQAAWLGGSRRAQELSNNQRKRRSANRERAGIPLVSSQKGEFFCSKAVGVAGR